MKALKIILIVLVVLVGGYSIWMATIDPEYRVERTTVIDAEPATVYATVSDFTTWDEWSKWHQMDPDMEVTYGDVSAGEGATYTWKGNEDVGAGTQTITAAVPNEALETHIAFEGMGESDGYWKFEPTEDGKTQVTWGFTGEMPFFFRIVGLGMDEQVGADFEEGLDNLKEKIESMPKEPEVAIETVEVEAMPYYGIRHEMAWEDLSIDFYSNNYDRITNYLGEDVENMSMPPFAIFYVWDEENKRTEMEIAIATDSDKPGTDSIKKGTTYSGKALKAVHTGGYDLEAEHMALNEYIEENGLNMAGAVWEVYMTNPAEEPDTSKWVTEIYYPIMPTGQESAENL